MRILIVFITLLFSSHITLAQKKKAAQKDPVVVADSLFRAGRYQDAIPSYITGLKKAQATPNAQPWFRLGFSYHSLKEYQKAIDAYSTAEAINPQFPGLRVSMAKSYSALGEITKSVVTLDSAVRTGFGNYKLLDTDPDFENLRKSDQYGAMRLRVYNSAYPCETLAAARAFDFWLGEWDVYVTANLSTKAGFNRITRVSGGCVIMESWESQGPHNGVSINYYDPANGKWKQKWAGSGQDIMEFYDGECVDGVMRFRYDIVGTDGSVMPGKLEFTNMESGNVRQHFQRSDDGGKSWQTVYDFTYVRRKS